MKILKLLGILFIGVLLYSDSAEAKRRSRIGKAFHKIKRTVSTMGRKILDKPPKHRSRFDKYPLYVLRYQQFIWKRFFQHYLNSVHDGRPTLPKPGCWNIRCWMKRNRFKRYWKRRSNIPIDGKNSSPFLHRRCRLPGTRGPRCRREHIRHDYYWRMFMWIGRAGFPKQPVRKRICITAYCRLQKRRWKRYWTRFWTYTSLVPVIRPYDFRWRAWFWRYSGDPTRLQQFVSPALMTMGMGGMLRGVGMGGMGMMHGGMMGMHGGMGMSTGFMGGNRLTLEMKQAMLAIMQRDLAKTAQITTTSQYALQQQRQALMMLMQMPAYPSAISAQMQMQSMMRNMYYQQYMQQYQMQQMLQQQIWSMARYLRGYCGCSSCSHGGRYGASLPAGSSMYIGGAGMYNPVNPSLMARRITGSTMLGGGFNSPGSMGIPMNPVNNQMELQMRVQALYAKNNLPY